MSQPRFAPITAALLARKGSATPSSMTGLSPAAPPSVPSKEASTPPAAENSALPEQEAHHKKLFVSLSHAEHERLAIAAVKTGLTRHQLIRDALDLYFEQISRDLGEECRCVAGTNCLRVC
jgi:hypothetical protein